MFTEQIILAWRLMFKPLTDRIKLGEGGIAAFNLAHAWIATRDAGITMVVFLLSLLCLTVLYGFNDYVDRYDDKLNPKKDQDFVADIVKHPRLMLTLNITSCVLLLVLTYLVLGTKQSLYGGMLLIANALYSLRLKKTPGADIVIVIIWGGLFTLLVPVVNYSLATLAGLMTGMAHVFQMLSDAETDKKNNVQTTVVCFPKSSYMALFLLSALAAWLVHCIADTKMALSSFVPLLIFAISKNVGVAWLLSRIYFVFLWIYMLIKFY
jgi:4-hydroxybenzoate polyprenyltransferase